MSRHDRPPHRTFGRLSLEPLEARDVPAIYAVQLTSPAIGVHGESAAVVVSGGLQTDPMQSPDDFEVVYLHADSPQEAIRRAIVGTIQVQFGSSSVEYTYTPESAQPTASANQPFFVAAIPIPGSPPPPPGSPPTVGPVADWEIKLEDLAGLPNPDWDYNDHHWTVRTVEVENFPVGEGTISGVMWNDSPTPNNVQDPTDPVLGGVAVGLFDAQGWFFQATRTNSAGEYAFASLPNATYKVQALSAGFEPVVKGPGTPTGPGNDLNGTGWTDPLPITGNMPIIQNGGMKGKADPPPANVNIQSITWVEIKDTGARVDSAPKYEKRGFPASDRAFPEVRVDLSGQPKTVTKGTAIADEIELRVQLTNKEAAAGVTVWVRLVDVDDPSANKVVPNVYDVTSDPDGEVDNTDGFSQIGNIEPGDNRGQLEVATGSKAADATGLATFKFKLTRKPGNNFRAVATIDPVVDVAKFAGKKNDKEAKVYVVPATGNNVGAEVPRADGKVKTAGSNLLTIWRTLYTEMDSLSLPPAENTYGEVHPRNLGQHRVAMDPGDTPLVTLRGIFWDAYIQVNTANLLSHSSVNPNNTVDFQQYVEKLTAKPGNTVIPGIETGGGGELNTWLGKSKRDTPASDGLWGVWVIGSYEGWEAASGNKPNLVLGATISPNALAGPQRPIYLFSENIRRLNARHVTNPVDGKTPVDIQIFRARVLAHEILHRFGGEHGTKGILGDNADGEYLDKRHIYEKSFGMNNKELKLVRDSAKELT